MGRVHIPFWKDLKKKIFSREKFSRGEKSWRRVTAKTWLEEVTFLRRSQARFSTSLFVKKGTFTTFHENARSCSIYEGVVFVVF